MPHFETLQVHAGQEEADPATGARAVPIYQTTSYVFRDCRQAADRFALKEPGNIYSRLTNPTEEVLEKRMAALDGGVGALAVSSGSSAVLLALQSLVRSGDHIVAQRSIYGGSFNLLSQTMPRQGVSTTFVDTSDFANIERAITENTRAVYVETMGNPCSDLTDIDAAAEIAHRHGIMLVVDNTFATPYLLRPIEHGADLVVYSATKFLGGHGTSLAGIIVDGGRFDYAASGRYPWLTEPDPSYHGLSYTGIAGKAALITYIRAQLLRDEGPCLSPFNCFLILQGLETLSLRVERHVENALKVIDYLKTCPLVEKIHHPSLPDSPDHALYERYFPKGAGSIFLVDLKGGAETAVKFVDSLKLFSLLANVADTKSLVIHPASTTHSQMPAGEQLKAGIRPGSVRFSIGIENAEDIIADLDQAFRACGD